ncbi:MAG: hypothetical protein QW620_05655 [Thermoplasmata archaeon]
MVENVIPKLRIANYRVVDASGEIRVDTNEILDFFERVSEEETVVYVIDLNGFTEGTPHLDILSEISDLIPIWVEANSKSVEDVSDLLMAGVEKVVLEIGKVTPHALQRIGEETTSVALLLYEQGLEAVEKMYTFLRKTGCEIILRNCKDKNFGRALQGIPVILDVACADEDMPQVTEKLNIVGKIVEADLNDI